MTSPETRTPSPDQQSAPFLVYGAAGARGSAVARRLLDRGAAVRVLGHVPHPGAAGVLEDLRARGAEVVDADLDDPASLRKASLGVRRVFLHPPLVGRADHTLEQMKAALDAASGAGVDRLVLATNSAVPPQDSGVTSVDVNRSVEALLGASGVPAVVLRPTLYLGNLTAPWSLPRILSAGELAYPLPETVEVSWLDPADAADAATRALLSEDADLSGHPPVTLGGPAAVRGAELAAAVSGAAQRPVVYVPQSPDEFAEGLAPVLGDAAAADVASLYHYLSAHGAELLDVPAEPVTSALGRSPRSVQQWAAEEAWA